MRVGNRDRGAGRRRICLARATLSRRAFRRRLKTSPNFGRHTAAQADALLAAPDTGAWTGRRDRVLMLLMLTSGPRVSEITHLTWADIILDRPGARVLWHGKGRKERATPVQE